MQNFLSGLLNKLGFASSSQTENQAANQTTMPEIHTQPDQPLSFGFKTNWLAVKSDSPEAVLEKLPLQNIQPANWQSSFQIMEAADYQSSLQPVFVSPCIRGWVFVVSHLALPCLHPEQPFNMLTEPLLDRFKEVQYFGSYRVTDYLAWAKAEDGKWIRRFETSDSCILENFGGQTAAEKSLNLVYVESEEEFERNEVFEKWIAAQDEETPAQLAGLWSINPLELENMDLPSSTGYLGYFDKTENP